MYSSWGGQSHPGPVVPRTAFSAQHNNPHMSFLSAPSQAGKMQGGGYYNGSPLSDTNNPLHAFFNVPSKTLKSNPHNSMEEDIRDMYQAYVGQSQAMEHIMITKQTNTMMWPITEVMPWKEARGLKVEWARMIFNDEYLGDRPEQGVSRVIRNFETSGSTTLGPKGLAFMMETGFYETEKGEMVYHLNIQQINNAVADYYSFGICYALANCTLPPEFRAQRGDNDQKIEDKLFENLSYFGILQRKKHGFAMLLKKAQAVMQSQSRRNGNIAIMPEGSLFALQEANLDVLNVNAQEKMRIDNFGSSTVAIRESRQYLVGERMRVNPLRELREFGDFTYMTTGHLTSAKSADRHTGQQDIWVWNESLDSYSHLSYREMLGYTGIFEGMSGQMNANASRPTNARTSVGGFRINQNELMQREFFLRGMNAIPDERDDGLQRVGDVDMDMKHMEGMGGRYGSSNSRKRKMIGADSKSYESGGRAGRSNNKGMTLTTLGRKWLTSKYDNWWHMCQATGDAPLILNAVLESSKASELTKELVINLYKDEAKEKQTSQQEAHLDIIGKETMLKTACDSLAEILAVIQSVQVHVPENKQEEKEHREMLKMMISSVGVVGDDLKKARDVIIQIANEHNIPLSTIPILEISGEILTRLQSIGIQNKRPVRSNEEADRIHQQINNQPNDLASRSRRAASLPVHQNDPDSSIDSGSESEGTHARRPNQAGFQRAYDSAQNDGNEPSSSSYGLGNLYPSDAEQPNGVNGAQAGGNLSDYSARVASQSRPRTREQNDEAKRIRQREAQQRREANREANIRAKRLKKDADDAILKSIRDAKARGTALSEEQKLEERRLLQKHSSSEEESGSDSQEQPDKDPNLELLDLWVNKTRPKSTGPKAQTLLEIKYLFDLLANRSFDIPGALDAIFVKGSEIGSDPVKMKAFLHSKTYLQACWKSDVEFGVKGTLDGVDLSDIIPDDKSLDIGLFTPAWLPENTGILDANEYNDVSTVKDIRNIYPVALNYRMIFKFKDRVAALHMCTVHSDADGLVPLDHQANDIKTKMRVYATLNILASLIAQEMSTPTQDQGEALKFAKDCWQCIHYCIGGGILPKYFDLWYELKPCTAQLTPGDSNYFNLTRAVMLEFSKARNMGQVRSVATTVTNNPSIAAMFASMNQVNNKWSQKWSQSFEPSDASAIGKTAKEILEKYQTYYATVSNFPNKNNSRPQDVSKMLAEVRNDAIATYKAVGIPEDTMVDDGQALFMALGEFVTSTANVFPKLTLSSYKYILQYLERVQVHYKSIGIQRSITTPDYRFAILRSIDTFFHVKAHGAPTDQLEFSAFDVFAGTLATEYANSNPDPTKPYVAPVVGNTTCDAAYQKFTEDLKNATRQRLASSSTGGAVLYYSMAGYQTDPKDKTKFVRKTFLDRVLAGEKLSPSEVRHILSERSDFTSCAFIEFLLDNDLPCPIGIINFRPHIRFMSYKFILTVDGGEVGHSYYLKPNFMFADSAQVKTKYGHYTVYGRPIIEDPTKVVVIPDVYVTDYSGGWDISHWNAGDPEHLAAHKQNPYAFSMYHMAVESNWKPVKKYMDITGLPLDVDRTISSMDIDVGGLNGPDIIRSYSSAAWYSSAEVWHFDQFLGILQGAEAGAVGIQKRNTLCFQGYQRMFDPLNPSNPMIVCDAGPWSGAIYPGSARDRKTGGPVMKEINYGDTYSQLS